MTYIRSNNRGFTLIELMIVVVIIGILAAMAIPRFMAASTKTRQSEAKLILKQIYVNERTWIQQSPSSTYWIPGATASAANPTAFEAIWIEIMADAKYEYAIEGDDHTFTATATGNIDTDDVLDVWTIDHFGNLTNVTNDATEGDA